MRIENTFMRHYDSSKAHDIKLFVTIFASALDDVLPAPLARLWALYVDVVRILLGYEITESLLVEAEVKYHEFLDAFRKAFGTKYSLPPNFHYLMHIPDNIRQYGPSFAFWWYVYYHTHTHPHTRTHTHTHTHTHTQTHALTHTPHPIY